MKEKYLMFIYYLVMELPEIAILSVLIYFPIFIIYRMRCGKKPIIRYFSVYCLVSTLLIIVFATIFIYGFEITYLSKYRFLNLIPFIWIKETYAMGIEEMMKQLLMNIIMLIPLGFILPVVSSKLRKCWRTLLLIIIFVVCIETFQYFIGRSADIDDLIMNTLGGLIGYGIYVGINNCCRNKAFWKKANDIGD
jgi:glycopeptide antibiotics resistance protein